jgi:hypothetical protein
MVLLLMAICALRMASSLLLLQVAAGSFSNLYRGYYCGQEVAVKILKEMQDDASQYQEFLQEVSIMRKVGMQCPVTAIATVGRAAHVLLIRAKCRVAWRWQLWAECLPCASMSVLHAGAPQERGAVHWCLHAQAQPVHRV